MIGYDKVETTPTGLVNVLREVKKDSFGDSAYCRVPLIVGAFDSYNAFISKVYQQVRDQDIHLTAARFDDAMRSLIDSQEVAEEIAKSCLSFRSVRFIKEHGLEKLTTLHDLVMDVSKVPRFNGDLGDFRSQYVNFFNGSRRIGVEAHEGVDRLELYQFSNGEGYVYLKYPSKIAKTGLVINHFL